LSSRIVARALELEELIALLSQEHQQQRKRLSELADVLEKEDCARGAELAREFDNSTVQHIVDEENVLLKLFVDAYGRKGADDAIRVFQQHRTMHKLADTISKNAMTSPEELGSMPSEFDRLVRSHFEAEEKRIFPWALKTHQAIRKNDPNASV
jgi:hemerythrin-like domain-containing protein